MDDIELNDLSCKEKEEQEVKEETDLGCRSAENDFLDRLDWLTSQREIENRQKTIWK